MRVDAVTRAVQLREWASQIQACLGSGMSVREWCVQQNIPQKTYYYRLRRVREELIENADSSNVLALPGRPVFAALSSPRLSGSAVMHIGQHTAEIHNGAEIETIERVLRVLSRL